jgi:hypothetical protein
MVHEQYSHLVLIKIYPENFMEEKALCVIANAFLFYEKVHHYTFTLYCVFIDNLCMAIFFKKK